MEPQTGPVKLVGRYRLTSVIGRGGLTDLWRAEDEVLGRTVAVKMLRTRAVSDGAIKRLFRVEALAAARLSHANITSVFDSGEHQGVPFLVMEYLGGGSLREVLEKGPIHPLRAAEWGAQICSALAYAHQAGIVHGDIRPENILFTEAGHLKVSDFAIARAASGGAAAQAAGGARSIYSCPEPDPDGRGDLYSLGVVLFECLAGQTPQKGAPDGTAAVSRPGSLRPGIPVELDAAVLKLLAPDPAQRFPSALSLGSTLERLIDDTRPAPPARVPRPAVPPDASARPTFLRTEGRWLFPTILVIAAAIGLALALPSIRQNLPGLRFTNPAPGPAGAPVRVVRAFDFDPPPGDARENSGRVPFAFDSDPSTTWATSSYRTADFGRLKEGVGIAFDLGAPAELSGVRVLSSAGGWRGGVRFSDDGVNFSPAPAGVTAGQDQVFETAGSHRYWMIWITRLAQTPGEGTTDNPFTVAIREIVPQAG